MLLFCLDLLTRLGIVLPGDLLAETLPSGILRRLLGRLALHKVADYRGVALCDVLMRVDDREAHLDELVEDKAEVISGVCSVQDEGFVILLIQCLTYLDGDLLVRLYLHLQGRQAAVALYGDRPLVVE